MVKKNLAKYLQIRNVLAERITSGYYPVGTMTPSEPELSKVFGTSRMTVRQALLELEKSGLVKRVQGKGTFVLDQKQSLDTENIMILQPGPGRIVSTGSLFKAMMGIFEAGHELGVNLNIFNYRDEGPEKLLAGSDKIIMPLPTEPILALIPSLLAAGKKLFVINRILKDFPEVCCFSTDHFESMRHMTNFFIQKGHRRIGFVGSTERYHLELRYLGYRKALEENGLEFDEKLFCKYEGLSLEGLNFKEIIQSDITALLLSEGRSLPLLVQEIEAADKVSWGDIEVATFNRVDENVPHAAEVHQMIEPLKNMGKMAVKAAVVPQECNFSNCNLFPGDLSLKNVKLGD